MEKLNLFFSRIKELTIWQRIFSWSSVRSLSYDAFEEFKSQGSILNEQKKLIEDTRNSVTKIRTENESLEKQVQDAKIQITKKDGQIEGLTSKVDSLNATVASTEKKLSRFETSKEERTKEYEKKIAQIDQVKRDLELRRSQLDDDRLKEQQDQFEIMKRQWAEHENSVEQTIRLICQNHLINYVDKVPFKGNPDNTIEICNEFIVFDSKSPANDDLTNFPKYVKAQAESVAKYANQELVRKDIFLVVPSNTIDTISQVSYNMGDYNVYVITKDSLEPIILSLKKIEEYEFAEQLSPEDRDNICRVIGRFAHTTKRKIQIDQFFTNQFIDLLVKCKNDLPEDLLKSVVEYEKAEKLNPPTERRAKQILTSDLIEKNEAINVEAQMRKIEIPSKLEEVKELV